MLHTLGEKIEYKPNEIDLMHKRLEDVEHNYDIIFNMSSFYGFYTVIIHPNAASLFDLIVTNERQVPKQCKTYFY